MAGADEVSIRVCFMHPSPPLDSNVYTAAEILPDLKNSQFAVPQVFSISIPEEPAMTAGVLPFMVW